MKQKDLNTVMAVFFGIAFALLLQNLFDNILKNVDIIEIFDDGNIKNKKVHRFLIALNLGVFLVKYFIDDIVYAIGKQEKICGKVITLLILAWTFFMIACASVSSGSMLIPLATWTLGIVIVQLALKETHNSNKDYRFENCVYLAFLVTTMIIFVIVSVIGKIPNANPELLSLLLLSLLTVVLFFRGFCNKWC